MNEKRAPLTPAERMQRTRDKRKKAGLVQLLVWTHQEHKNKIKRYVEDINK